MSTIRDTVADLEERPYRNGFLVTFGLSYWFAALLQPDLVATVGRRFSAAGLVVMGALVLGNLVLESRALWALLGVFLASGVVSSWVGVATWTVPYSAEAAAVSMAALNAVSAVILFATALQE